MALKFIKPSMTCLTQMSSSSSRAIDSAIGAWHRQRSRRRTAGVGSWHGKGSHRTAARLRMCRVTPEEGCLSSSAWGIGRMPPTPSSAEVALAADAGSRDGAVRSGHGGGQPGRWPGAVAGHRFGGVGPMTMVDLQIRCPGGPAVQRQGGAPKTTHV